MIPEYNLSQFTWKPERKTLIAEASDLGIRPGQGFPKDMNVLSHRTGRLVRWEYDERAAEKAEWWDGQEAHYLTREPGCNADTLVIIND